MVFEESETVELKSEVCGDICKEVVAFANTRGGTLYVGVRDDGVAAGVEDADKVTLQLNNMVRDSIKPDVTMFVRYETLLIAGKKIVAVAVQKGVGRPYYLAGKGLRPGGVYVRNGNAADPATDAAIRKMIKETDGDSFETRRSLEQDLSFERASAEFTKRNTPFDETKMRILGMESQDGVYSNVALLLSDQCPATVKAAVFSGKDKSVFEDRREFGGSLFRQLEELYGYLDMRNKRAASFEGLYRNDRRDYPEDALREALINSFVHRDYSFNSSALVSLYDDRLEIVSVGGLPSGIALEDIMLGLSVCRNPKLAAVFYRLGLIEAYGVGIPKMMRAYEGSGLKPTIEATANAFKVVLPNRNALAGSAPPASSGTYEDRILELARANGPIVRNEVEKLLDISQATANRLLRRMTDGGMLCKEGGGRSTTYRRR